MSLVQMVSDFNGNVEINGVTYLSSSIQVSVNEENSDAINMKYFKDFIVFNVNYSDFEYGITFNNVTIFQSAGNTLQEVLDRIDILLDDSIFKGTVAALAGAFTDSSSSYSGRAIHAEGESYLGGQVDIDGGLSVSSGNSTLNNFSVNNYAVFNTGTQTLQGGEIRLAQAVLNHVGQGGTDTAYYTKVRGAALLNNHVVVSLPSVPIPNSGGPYAIVQDPITGDASWADTSTFGGGGGLWTQAGNDIYYNTGNVGIGTAAPESSLHIAGASGITMGRNSIQNQVARVYADANDNLILSSATGSGKSIRLNNYVFGSSIDWNFTNSTANKMDFSFSPNGWGGSNAPSLASFNSTVGYSTGDWRMFKVENTLNQSGDAAFTDLFINRTENSVGTGNQYFIDAHNNGVSNFNVDSQGKAYAAGGLKTIGDSYNNTVFLGQKSTYFTIESSHVGDMMRFYPSVNRIQTVQPLAVGTSASPSSTDLMALKHWSSNAAHNMIKSFATDGSDAFFLKTDGKVGIGTSTPSSKLHVVGNTYVQGDAAIGPQADGGPISGYTLSIRDTVPSIYLKDQSGTVGDGRIHVNSNIFSIGVDPDNVTADAALRFETRGSERMRIDADGRVGIGTSTPTAKLDVEGNIFMSEGSKLMSETTDPINGAQSQSLEFYLPYRSDGVTMAENKSALKLGGNKFFEPRTTNRSILHVFGGLQIEPTNSVDSAGSLGISFGSSSDQYPSTTVTLGSWANFSQTDDRHFQNYGYFGVRFEANGARYSTDGQSLGEFNTTGLGVGTNSPTAKLDVVGKANINDGNNNVLISTNNSTITAGDNTAVGYRSLTSLTTGDGNTSVGVEALRDTTTGVRNTAVGVSAGAVVNTSYNAIFGYQAGQLFSGNSNTAMGYLAGKYSSGGGNALIGAEAGEGVSGSSTFSNTVAVGYQALTALTTGLRNTAVGYQAGDSVLAGADNTFLGYGTDLVNGNNSFNTVIGSGAYVNSNGNRMTAVGYSARAGGGSTSIGAQAGNNDSGNSVAMGYQAGNGAGGWNTSIGNSAHTLSTGSYNTSIGGGANRYTSGDNNVAVGNAAAYGVQNTSTFSNTVAVGHSALTALTTGTGNTAVGYQAGLATIANNNGTFLGHQAGLNSSGSSNIAVGVNSGPSGSSTSNIAIGNNAFSGENGQSHNVVIGHNAASAAGPHSLYSNVIIGNNSGLSLGSVSNSNTIIGYNNVRHQSVAEGVTAIGGSISWPSIGDYSTSIGVFCKAGAYSTAIGRGTGSHLSQYSVFIGVNAGNNETGSNKLYIENSDSSTPLIYGEFDNDIVRVNGELQVGDPASTGFKLPTADGTSGQVLSTNGSGAVTWVSQSGGGGGASTLNDLTDVIIPSVADGDLLNYSLAFSSWIPVNSISLAGNITSAAIVQGNTGSFTTTTSESYKFVGTGDFSIEPATTLGGDLYIKSNKDIIVEIDTNNNDTPSKFSVVDVTERFSVDDAGVARFNNAFSLPNADGTAGQVLSTDGSGAVTWANQSADIQLAYEVAGEATGRTLVAGDHLKYLRSTSATAVTFTVPPQSSVAWADNAEVVFEQAGAGQITIAAGAGVTINSSETLKSGQQYALIGLKRVASDTWTLTGERELA